VATASIDTFDASAAPNSIDPIENLLEGMGFPNERSRTVVNSTVRSSRRGFVLFAFATASPCDVRTSEAS